MYSFAVIAIHHSRHNIYPALTEIIFCKTSPEALAAKDMVKKHSLDSLDQGQICVIRTINGEDMSTEYQVGDDKYVGVFDFDQYRKKWLELEVSARGKEYLPLRAR